MPIYEYQCDACGNVLEVLQKISEKPLTECTQCSGRLHKLVSQTSFHLKGTGWYVTDYAGKGKKQDRGGDADSGADSTQKPASDASKAAEPSKSSSD